MYATDGPGITMMGRLAAAKSSSVDPDTIRGRYLRRSGVLDVHRGLAAAARPADEVVVDAQAAVGDVGLTFAGDSRVLVARELVVLALPEQDVVALVAEQ